MKSPAGSSMRAPLTFVLKAPPAFVAGPPERAILREAYVEAILSAVPVLPFDLRVARTHAPLWADLRTQPIGPSTCRSRPPPCPTHAPCSRPASGTSSACGVSPLPDSTSNRKGRRHSGTREWYNPSTEPKMDSRDPTSDLGANDSEFAEGIPFP